MEVYNAKIHLDMIKSVLDEYASLGPLTIDSYTAIEFIINTYLIAVGFRPLFFEDSMGQKTEFHENLIYKTKALFPQLTFHRKGPHIYIHNPLLIIDYDNINSKELGLLLNFITQLDDFERTSVDLHFSFRYKNIGDIPLTGYFIRETTQSSEISNKISQLNLLLKDFNIRVRSEISNV